MFGVLSGVPLFSFLSPMSGHVLVSMSICETVLFTGKYDQNTEHPIFDEYQVSIPKGTFPFPGLSERFSSRENYKNSQENVLSGMVATEKHQSPNRKEGS